MPVTIYLPNVLARLAEGSRTLPEEGRTVGEVVDRIALRYPGLGPRLRDAEGQPYQFVTIYLNDEDIRLAQGFDTPVTDGDELTVVPAVAGG
ncbi:MAG: MoaD/ThiS family protein [Gemmatimonadales bacterium]